MKTRSLRRALSAFLIVVFALGFVQTGLLASVSGTPDAQSSAGGIDLGLKPPPGVDLTTLAGGAVAALPKAPAHMIVERLTVAPGKSLDVRRPGQELVVVYVESDSLTFIDASGLEAPTSAGTQIVLPPTIQYTARNDGSLPASFLRMSLSSLSPAPGPSTTAAANPPAATGGATPIQLDMEDIKFSTNALTIPANTDVTIHITNIGATFHDFSIDALKISTGNVAPGASVDVKINAPAGTYTYYCNVPGHEAAGMKGTLTVAATTPSPTPVLPSATSAPPAATPVGSDKILLDSQIETLPDGPVVIFLARAAFHPGAQTGKSVLSGPLGIIAEHGTLKVSRTNLLAANLPEGKGVLLPMGTEVQFANAGNQGSSQKTEKIVR